MKRLSQEEVEERILNKTNGKIKVISKYNGYNSSIFLQCNECNFKWEEFGYIVKNDRKIIKCPQCQEYYKKNPYLVYMHIFPNKKIYIGITSTSTSFRWKNGKGYKNNPYLINAINKYKWENIEHKILFSHLSKEEACKKEKELIKKYKTNNRKYGYNITEGGEGVKIPSKVIIVQYSLDGKFLHTYSSIREASDETQICYKSIEHCIQGIQKKAGNFIWRKFDKNESYPLKISKYTHNRGVKVQFSKNVGIKICQLDENKKIIKVWKNIKSAANEIKKSPSSIRYAIKMKSKCNNYYWEYYNEEEYEK